MQAKACEDLERGQARGGLGWLGKGRQRMRRKAPQGSVLLGRWFSQRRKERRENPSGVSQVENLSVF